MDIKLGVPLTFSADADKFVALGIPIFPCSSENKRPLTPASQPGAPQRLAAGEIGPGHEALGGFHRATTDRAQIDEWKRRRPHAYIGVPCGVPFAPISVLDVDRTEAQKEGQEEGHAGWEKLLEVLGEDGITEALLAGALVWTRTGGLHLVFADDDRLSNKQNVKHLDKLLDWRGRASGYIVAYASDANPQREWWHRLGDLKRAPDAVVKMFDKPGAEPTAERPKMDLPPATAPLRMSACGNALCDAYGHVERQVEGARTLSDGRQDVPGRVGRVLGGYAAGGHLTASDADALTRRLVSVVEGYGSEYASRHPESPELRVARAVGDGRGSPIRDCAVMSADAQEAYLEAREAAWDAGEFDLPDDGLKPAPSTASEASSEPGKGMDSNAPAATPAAAAPSSGSGGELERWQMAVREAFTFPDAVEVVDFVKERPGRDRSFFVIRTREHGEAVIHDLTNYRATNRVLFDRFNGRIKKGLSQKVWMDHVVALGKAAHINPLHGHLTNESQVSEWISKVIRDEEGDVKLYEWDGEEWATMVNHLRGTGPAGLGEAGIMDVRGARSMVFHNDRIRRAVNGVGTAEYKDGDISSVLREYGFEHRRLGRKSGDGVMMRVRVWCSEQALSLLAGDLGVKT